MKYTDKYDVVYADPPWQYRDKCHSGQRGVEYKYSVMSKKDIMDLPVSGIVANDCVLFLWATFPLLPYAIDVMSAWGFEYRTIGFVWAKTNKRSDTWFMGMGNWTRSNAELCLLGVRGKPKRVSASVRSLIVSPVREHSRKPDEVRESIEELMGPVKRLEMFATGRYSGWDVWGNEVESDLVLKSGKFEKQSGAQ